MGTPQAASKWLQEKVATYSNDSRDANKSTIFDTTALSGIVVVDSSPGRISCLFPVTRQVCTVAGYLHGGCIGTLIDSVGTAALATLSQNLGVSAHIKVELFNHAREGTDVEVHAEVVSIAERTATIDCTIWLSEGVRVARGTHIKFLNPKAGAVPSAKALDVKLISSL